jgi:hypothetical protein
MKTLGRTFRGGFGKADHGLQPVDEQLPVGQPGQVVMNRIMQQPVFRRLLLGDIDNGADAADHLAIGAEHRPGAQRHPVVMAVFGAHPELVIEPALAVFEQDIERGAEPVAVIGVNARQPVARRPRERARGKPQLRREIRRSDDTVAHHVPVPDRVARSRQRHGLALHVRKRPW